MKYEFYLPTPKELIQKAHKIIKLATDHNVQTLEDCMNLSSKDFFRISNFVGHFSRAFSYIKESYYVMALTLKHFGEEEFSKDQFTKVAKEIFDMEIEHGRFVKYEESYSVQLITNSLKYFEHIEVIKYNKGKIQVTNQTYIDEIINQTARELADALTFNLRSVY